MEQLHDELPHVPLSQFMLVTTAKVHCSLLDQVSYLLNQISPLGDFSDSLQCSNWLEAFANRHIRHIRAIRDSRPPRGPRP